MQEAPKHMDNAEKDLNAAKAEEATGDEQKAIDAMAQADQEAGKLEAELAKAAEAEQGPPENGQGKPEIGPELAKALGQMKDAAQQMRGQDTKEGAKSMDKAAANLAKAAMKMMQAGQFKRMLSKQDMAKGIRGLKSKPEDVADLKTLKLTSEEWNRLPGELKQQLLQAMKGNYPEEYRQLIRDYFSNLAKTGVKVENKE